MMEGKLGHLLVALFAMLVSASFQLVACCSNFQLVACCSPCLPFAVALLGQTGTSGWLRSSFIFVELWRCSFVFGVRSCWRPSLPQTVVAVPAVGVFFHHGIGTLFYDCGHLRL